MQQQTAFIIIVALIAMAVLFQLHRMFVRSQNKQEKENEATAVRFSHKHPTQREP